MAAQTGGKTGTRWIIIGAACVVVAALFWRADNAPVPESAVQWLESYDQAIVKAKREHKAVLLDFSAEWCPPCKEMQRDVFSNPEVGKALERFVVSVRVDLTDRPKTGPAATLADRYGIEALPSIVLVDTKGNILGKQRGSMTAKELTAFVEAGAGRYVGGDATNLGTRN